MIPPTKHNWKKLGQVFDPTASRPRPWMQEFAQCPTPLLLDESTIRVYLATRPPLDGDLQYVAHPGYVDVARDDPTRVVGIAPTPILDLGKRGMFDEFGVMPGSAIRSGNEILLYYTGWTRARSVPYTLAIGIARSKDGGASFERLGDGPLLTVSANEPCLVTGPVVRQMETRWHMWYLSGREWLAIKGRMEPIYRIVHATSQDGMHWSRNGQPIIPCHTAHECQDILAPYFRDGKWHALFAFRDPAMYQGAYRLGYASSDDLESWVRDDSLAGIGLSNSGWDSAMQCYPQPIEVDGRLLLFYCGNAFGREGFGVAELDCD